MAHSIAQVATSPKSKSQSHTKQPSLRIVISKAPGIGISTLPAQEQDNFPYTDIPRPNVGEANKRPEYIMWGMFQSRANQWHCTMSYVGFVLTLGIVGTLVGYGATRDMELVYYMVATAYGAITWIAACVCARRHLNEHIQHLTDYVESVMDQPGRMSVSSNSSASVAVVGAGQDEFRL